MLGWGLYGRKPCAPTMGKIGEKGVIWAQTLRPYEGKNRGKVFHQNQYQI